VSSDEGALTVGSAAQEERLRDLASELERVRRPLPRLPWPSVDIGVRLRTTPWLRRLLPARLEISRAGRRGWLTWERWPQDRTHFSAGMEAIVGATARAGEVEQLTRAHLRESEMQRTLFWRPWEAANMDAATEEHLQAALADGRGVLLSMCHLGPYFHSASLGPTLRRPVFMVGGSWCFADPAPDYWGRRQVRRMEGLRKRDGRMVPATGSFAVLRALLEEGELVLMHFDVPGRHETHFLGKPVMLTTGTAKLAAMTDAFVVPLRFRREGHRVWVDAQAPLDPRAHGSVEQLHGALAAVHERFILERPETLEDPRRAGFWEGASAAGWPLRELYVSTTTTFKP
jgi:lauroyl/myristoyl acyltransferase